MKTNVTLKLDSDLLREARVLVAEEGSSISALLTSRLGELIRDRKAFEKAAAYCSDGSGALYIAADGKSETCLTARTPAH